MDVAQLSIAVDSSDVTKATDKVFKLADAAKAAALAFASWEVVRYAKEAATLAARYETLGVVMGAVGKNAGYGAGQMAMFAEQLQQTGISAIESRNVLTMMAGAQMDLAKSAQMARIAQDAAVIGNINSSEAFQRMVQGIRSGETEILRTIGISVNFEQSYQKLAATLGKNAKDLTDLEKLQARQNMVMEYGTKIAGAYESAMGTAGKQMLSMERYLEDLQVKIGSVFQPSLSEGVMSLTYSLKSMSDWIDVNGAGMQDLAQAMKSTLGAGEEFLGMLGQMAGGSGSASDALDALTNVVRGVGLAIAATSDVARKDGALIKGLIDSITEGGDAAHAKWNKTVTGQSSVDKFLEAVEKGQGKVKDAAAKTEQLAAAQDAVNRYTSEYTKLQNAMQSAPGGMSKENQDLLAEVGLWKDIYTFKLASIKAGTPEEMGPVAPVSDGGAAEAARKAAALAAYAQALMHKVEVMKWEADAYDKSADAASKYADATLKDRQSLDEFILSLQPAKMEAEKMKQVTYDLGWALAEGSINQREYNNLLGAAADKYTAAGQAAKAYQDRLEADAARLNQKDDYATRIARLNELNGTGKLAPEAYARELHKLQLESKTVWGAMAYSIENFADQGASALASFFNGTKTGFREMVSSLLVDIERLILKEQVMGPLMKSITGSSWLAGAFGAGGGSMGGGGSFDWSNPNSMPSMANPSSGSSGSMAPIIVNISTTGEASVKGGDSSDAKKLGALVGAKVREVITQERRSGGLLNPV